MWAIGHLPHEPNLHEKPKKLDIAEYWMNGTLEKWNAEYVFHYVKNRTVFNFEILFRTLSHITYLSNIPLFQISIIPALITLGYIFSNPFFPDNEVKKNKPYNPSCFF
jgi:DNA polymerase elongation subunit (family B)